MKAQKGYLLIEGGSHSRLSPRGWWQRIVRWHDVSRERQILAALNDDALKDMGLSRADVEQETHQHFWDDPMSKGR
ncbi:DUF1127 domain-containing protein [Pseudomonas gingeri]|uniref:DUF1127 domain-containing protein n=1 Tax=Pseudomonas gingeri TaxID=117681 RepID=A0A7Y7XIK9_9PSED|nr:DUF1127 domain-containing protein [Pseudomonas gingeri]NWA27791.1 DUF1127 domain-containing protein [Pseudomonas gingeri]NWC00207.1 DUF1127 domain-containing protein [Pseudomonas gingeri]